MGLQETEENENGLERTQAWRVFAELFFDRWI
jgi:hypothetical protein